MATILRSNSGLLLRGHVRAIRRWLTTRTTDAALAAAPWLSESGIRLMQGALAHAGRFVPVLSRTVAENMRVLRVYSPAVHRDYFERIAAHLAGSLHIFRCAAPDRAAELAHLIAQRITLDDSVATLREATTDGRGAIVMTVHMVDLLLVMARFGQVLPTTVHLRHSKDARRRIAKERWCRATGLGFIADPDRSDAPLARLNRMAEVLRAGRVLMISPDLPQKAGDRGVGVSFFGRQVRFPAGAAMLALRTRAPLFSLIARPQDDGLCAVLRGPYPLGTVGRGPAGRQAAVAGAMQWFTDSLAEFITASPSLWYMWGDKRWTKLLRGDRRYVGRVDEADGFLDQPNPATFSPAPGAAV